MRADRQKKQLRREMHDRQVQKCPAQVLILTEATQGAEHLLMERNEHWLA